MTSLDKLQSLINDCSEAPIQSDMLQQMKELAASISREQAENSTLLKETLNELHEKSAENAKLTDQNSEILKEKKKYEAEISKLSAINREMVDRGYSMSVKLLDLREKRDNLNRSHFTSGAERSARIIKSDVEDPLSEDELAEALENAQKDDCLFFEIAHKEALLHDAMQTGEISDSVIANLKASVSENSTPDSPEDVEEKERLLISIQEDSSDEVSAFVESMKEQENQEKNWNKRSIGQREQIVGSISQKRKLYIDNDGELFEIQEECPPTPPIGLNGEPMKFVGYRYCYSEVTAMPIQFSLNSIYQPTFKETVAAGVDVSSAKIELSESLAGQNYVVSGVKKAMEEKKTGKKTSTKIRDIFVTTKVRPTLIKGCYAASYLMAMVLFCKFALGLPLNRLYSAGIFASSGFNLPLSVLEHWPILVFESKLCYLIPYFKAVLLASKAIHADETTMLVFRELGRSNTTKSYFWLYSTIRQAEKQVRLFDYEPGRKGSFALEFLGDFIGFLITDAYAGYNIFQQAKHCFCLIHARRKFFEVATCASLVYSRNKAAQIVHIMDKLFAIEKELLQLSTEERLKKRLEQMKTIVDELVSAIETLSKDDTIAKSSKLAAAVNYFLSHKKELLMFMTDGDVPLHNMVAENAIRPVTVGRKGWLFCGSPRGAAAVAGIFSIIETARANGLDPFKYLCFVLENMRGNDFMKDEALMQSLMPWSPLAQEKCRASWRSSSTISQSETMAS